MRVQRALQSRAVAKRNTRQMTPDEVLESQFGGPDTGIFTDGSCDPNPGQGGWGWVWVIRTWLPIPIVSSA